MKLLIFASFLVFVYNFPVENNSNNNNLPEEIQHAVCKISSKEIKASANATITRQLKGVCSPKDLETKLKALQDVLLTELKEIKNILGNVGITIPKLNEPQQSLKSNVANEESSYYDDEEEFQNEIIQKEDNVEYKLKFLDNPSNQETNLMNANDQLEEQIFKFNVSTKRVALGRVFYYYWKINGVYKIFAMDDILFDSPQFNFQGEFIQLSLIPHHFGSQYLNINVKGNLVNKHRFTIIDQKNSSNDITSPILVQPKSYDITHTKINNFINNNQLLIKLLVYLDI